MAYNAKEIWIPCDSQPQTLAAAAESTGIALESGGANMTRGLIYGVQIKAGAAVGANTSVDVRLYSDTSKTLLLYDVSFDLSVSNVTGGSVHDADTLATPIPVFETPFLTITPDDATSVTFTTTFFAAAMA